MTLLDIDRVGRVFGYGSTRIVALSEVSLQVDAGEFVAVMGPSGSGKSTLLNIAGGLERPTSGRVVLAGSDLATLGSAGLAMLRRRSVGFVFQNANLLPSLTAAENVALPLELDGLRARAALARAHGLLETLGLAPFAGRLPQSMSGGEQQRVAIARAVVGGRALLLADEPTGALDSLTGEAVVRLLHHECSLGRAVVLVTHDTRLAGWADRVVFLRDGRVADATAPPTGPEALLFPEEIR
jgi:putative ABC transport system ATP-binding protein